MLVAILESPEDEGLRMILADMVEEEEGLLFSDFLRGPGTVTIRGSDGLQVFFSGPKPANLPRCTFFKSDQQHLIFLGKLPSSFWPKCQCGHLADRVLEGVWVSYGHPVGEHLPNRGW